MASPLSILAQDAEMRRIWPGLRTIVAAPGWGVWRGIVKPLGRSYEIEISYIRPIGWDGHTLAHAWFPEVRVLSPRLSRRAQAPQTPIPHIYADPERPDLPLLCLFDPRTGGWHPSQAIAETILPWTVSWLGFYEIWQATGDWKGGGAPHGDLSTGSEERQPLARRDRRPVRARDLVRAASPEALNAAVGAAIHLEAAR